MGLRAMLATGEPLLQSDRWHFEQFQRPTAAQQQSSLAAVIGGAQCEGAQQVPEIVTEEDVVERPVADRKRRLRVGRLLEAGGLSESAVGKEVVAEEGEPVSKRVKISRELRGDAPERRGREEVLRAFEGREWSAERLAEKTMALLMRMLVAPAWQERHGAVVALQLLLRLLPKDAKEPAVKPLVVATCAVLTLDRFGDFASDAVVGPVTEPCAQLFARCCQVLPGGMALGLALMKELLEAGEKGIEASGEDADVQDFWDINPWNARFSAVLGLKYLLALRLASVAEDAVKSDDIVLEIVSIAARKMWTEESEDVSAVMMEMLSTALAYSGSESGWLAAFIAHPTQPQPKEPSYLIGFCRRCWKKLADLVPHGVGLCPYLQLLHHVTRTTKEMCPPQRMKEAITPFVDVLLGLVAQGSSNKETLNLVLLVVSCLGQEKLKLWTRALFACQLPLHPSNELSEVCRSIWRAIGLSLQEDTSTLVELLGASIHQKDEGAGTSYNTCAVLAILFMSTTQLDPFLKLVVELFNNDAKDVDQRWRILFLLLLYAEWSTTTLPPEFLHQLKPTTYTDLACLSPKTQLALKTTLSNLEALFSTAALPEHLLATFKQEQQRVGILNSARNLTNKTAADWIQYLPPPTTPAATQAWNKQAAEGTEQLTRVVEEATAELSFLTCRELASLAMLQLYAALTLPDRLNPVLNPILTMAVEAQSFGQASHLCRFAANAIDRVLFLCSPQKAKVVEKAIAQKLCTVGFSSPRYDVQGLIRELVALKQDGLFEALPSLWSHLCDVFRPIVHEEVTEAWVIDNVLSYELALLSDTLNPSLVGRAIGILHALLHPSSARVPEDSYRLLPSVFAWFNVACCSNLPLVNQSLREALEAVMLLAVEREQFFQLAWLCIHRVVVKMLQTPFLVAGRETNVEEADEASHRAIDMLGQVVQLQQRHVLANLSSLVPAVLKLMNDSSKSTTLTSAASRLFSQVIARVSVEVFENPQSASVSPGIVECVRREGDAFLNGLLQGVDKKQQQQTLERVQSKLRQGLELREYQVEAIVWLAFMAKYGLSCALCDDLGLGKTLMTLAACSLLQPSVVSIVVCPTSLVGHWAEEVDSHFIPSTFYTVTYAGSIADRAQKLQSLRNQAASRHILLLVSYTVLRRDVDKIEAALEGVDRGYVVLDEAHMIKNRASASAKACKRIGKQAPLRVALTGTPMHNDVLDLWSIFDFLLPGYLGSVSDFEADVAKGVRRGQNALGSDAPDVDSFLLRNAAMAKLSRLHAKLLPFTMRRLKEDVLSDLPPKIVQDMFVELSPLQQELVQSVTQSCRAGCDEKSVIGNVFKLLMICTHPLLYLRKLNTSKDRLAAIQVARWMSAAKDQGISASCKFEAAQQLFQDIGLGRSHPSQGESSPFGLAESVQRKALVFVQYSATLDILEEQVLKQSNIRYLRLDGSVPSHRRQAVTNQFNRSPAIDMLILTKRVGGQGLNLTGADVVIFLEHDWNPMVDLQAMDRAHRLGQRKTVHVYRILSQGTLEGKLMNAQRYKLRVAHTVIDDENASLEKMRTETLLELLGQEKSAEAGSGAEDKSVRVGKLNEMLNEIGELWEEEQYKDLSISAFLKSG